MLSNKSPTIEKVLIASVETLSAVESDYTAVSCAGWNGMGHPAV